jgi:hypothetical protein
MREVSGASALSRFFRTHILQIYVDGEIAHAVLVEIAPRALARSPDLIKLLR